MLRPGRKKREEFNERRLRRPADASGVQFNPGYWYCKRDVMLCSSGNCSIWHVSLPYPHFWPIALLQGWTIFMHCVQGPFSAYMANI